MKEVDTEAFLELSTSLASFYILKALHSTGSDVSRWYEEANISISEGEKQNAASEFVLMRKGLLLLAKGSFEAAEYQFSMVLEKIPGYLPAQIGMGCVHFGAGKYREALGAFQAVLRAMPSGPVELRLAIGFCMARLGFADAARQAFNRVLALSPGSNEAICALAVLNVNEGVRDPLLFQQGMKQLKQAYETDRTHPVALLHLGNHFFFRKDLVKSETLLRAALAKATGPKIRAECLFMLAKVAHQQAGKMDEAHKCYAEAVALNPTLVMAQFGLGQCLVARGDVNGAIGCFERILQIRSDCLEAARLLGLLLAGKSRSDPKVRAKAHSLLVRAAQMQMAPEEAVEVHLALASISSSPSDALESIRKAYELVPERFDSSPVLLNNLAVYCNADKEAVTALDMMERALGMARKGGQLHDTILFNKARLVEPKEARAIYTDLARRRPDMVEAHLRLGLMAASQGQSQDALESYKEAIGHDEHCAQAWLLLANAQLKQRALTPARKSFERVLAKIDRHDPYALVSMGNLYLELARATPATKEDALRKALEFYQKALQLDPRNHRAALGVGIILAESGRWSQAKDVFLQVRLADQSCIDAAISLGNCFVELGQFGAAVNAYESLLPAAHGKSRVTLLLYLSRALYLFAKAERSAGNPISTAQAHLTRAIDLLAEAQQKLPKDLPIQFNQALCQQELAALLIKALGSAIESEEQEAREAELVSVASSALDSATSIFTSLLGGGDGIDSKAAHQRMEYCGSLGQTLNSRQQKTSTKDNARQQHMAQLMARRAAEQADAEAAEIRKKTEWEAEQARIAEARKEMAEKLRIVDQKVRATSTGGSRQEPQEKKPKPTKDRSEGDPSSSDEEIVPRKRRGRASTGGRPSTLSKDMISTDDDMPLPSPTSEE